MYTTKQRTKQGGQEDDKAGDEKQDAGGQSNLCRNNQEAGRLQEKPGEDQLRDLQRQKGTAFPAPLQRELLFLRSPGSRQVTDKERRT